MMCALTEVCLPSTCRVTGLQAVCRLYRCRAMYCVIFFDVRVSMHPSSRRRCHWPAYQGGGTFEVLELAKGSSPRGRLTRAARCMLTDGRLGGRCSPYSRLLLD